jgi:hypothetical protein
MSNTRKLWAPSASPNHIGLADAKNNTIIISKNNNNESFITTDNKFLESNGLFNYVRIDIKNMKAYTSRDINFNVVNSNVDILPSSSNLELNESNAQFLVYEIKNSGIDVIYKSILTPFAFALDIVMFYDNSIIYEIEGSGYVLIRKSKIRF